MPFGGSGFLLQLLIPKKYILVFQGLLQSRVIGLMGLMGCAGFVGLIGFIYFTGL